MVATSTGGNKERMHLPSLAFGVVAPQVAGICVRLIDIRVGGTLLALQFDDNHVFAQQENGISPSRLKG